MKGVFILFLVSLSYFCAEADWELHVRIHSYNHLNSQRDFEGRHCDSLPDDPCENYFIFCLQFYEWSQTSNACQYRYLTANGPLEVRSGIIGGGGSSSSSATFSVGQNIFAQGVDNPLIYRGSGAWIQQFQFQLRVQDDDPIESDDLIDRVFVAKTGVAISESFTSPETYTGIYNNIRAVISYRANCQPDYYGTLCTVFCTGRDDDMGHFECNSEGQPVCLQGWTDLATNCLTPLCPSGCPTNSQCTGPEQCTCLSGWSGDSCDQCVPATGCVNGNCLSPGECECDPGYSGTLCDVDDDVCGHQSPCMNNGTCSNTGPDSHTCDCPPQFHGPNCEADVDECTNSTNACLNGATCVNHHGAFSCLCAAGYTGQDCGMDIDECSSAPCQNGGSCLDLLDDFNCTCPDGFAGPVCDIDIDNCVHPDLCLHGGTCVDQVAGYSCNCLPRYTGDQCETERPAPCSSNPCPANTYCVEDRDANTFTCEECQPGFESCDTVVVVNPDTQQGNNGTDVQPVNGMLIGGVIGGVVGALLLLCIIIAIVIACVKWCTCCPCVKLKHSEVDQYQAIGSGARQNPLYLGASTLLSSKSGTLRSTSDSMPRYSGGSSPQYAELSTVAEGVNYVPPPRQHSNPMYAVAQADIYRTGTPPTLPARRNGSIARPASPSQSPHYEHIPADMPNSIAPQEIKASGKYDRLIKPEAVPQTASSGKYDSLATPTTPAQDNPYIVDREDGYKVLPGDPRPAAEDESKETKNETVNTPPPTTNFNPYD